MSVKPCKFYDLTSGKPVLIGDYNDALDFLLNNPELMEAAPKVEKKEAPKKEEKEEKPKPKPKTTAKSYGDARDTIAKGANLTEAEIDEYLPAFLASYGISSGNKNTVNGAAFENLLSTDVSEITDYDAPKSNERKMAQKIADWVKSQQKEQGIEAIKMEDRPIEGSALDAHINAVDSLRKKLKNKTLADPFLASATAQLLLDAYSGILKAARAAGKIITRGQAMYAAQKQINADNKYSVQEMADAAKAVYAYEKGTVQKDINKTIGVKNETVKARVQKAINTAFNIGMGFGTQEGFQKGATAGMKAGFVAGADVTRTKIKDIVSAAIADLNGELSPKQVQQILNGIPKVFTKASYDKFSELVGNIIDDANYVERTSDIRSTQKRLRNKDFGNYANLVKNFLAINPRAIPLNLLSDYEKALAGLAQKRVPDVKVMNAVYNDIMDQIDPPATRDQLNALVKQIGSLEENKINTLEDYLEFSKALSSLDNTLNKLVAQGEITEIDAADIREAYNKAEIALRDGTKLDVQKQVTALKTKMINDAKQLSADVDMDGLTPLQKQTGNTLMQLPVSILKDFTPAQLDAYQKAIIGLSNGFLNTTTYDLIKQAGLIEKARNIAEATKDVIQAKTDTDSRNKLHQLINKYGSPFWNSVDKMTAQLLLKNKDYWDDFFGVGKKKPIWKKILSPIIDAVDKALHQTKVISSDYYKAVSGVSNIQKDRVALALIQMDYESNPSIIKGETIDHKDLPTSEKDYYRYITENLDSFARVSDKEKRRMKKAWNSMPKDANGNIDIEAYMKGLSPREKVLMEAIRNIYGKTEDYVRINTEKRGDPFQLRQDYANRVVRQKSEVDDATNAEFIEDVLGGKTPNAIRLKQAATNKRTGDRYYVSYNLDNMILSHIRDTFRDYYLTDPVRTTIGAMTRLATKSDANSNQQRFLVAMEEAVKQGLITTLDLQQEGSDSFSRGVDRLLRANRTLKLSTVRFVADFTSNLARLAIENPKAYVRATEILIDKDNKYDLLLEDLFTSVSDFSGILGQESITSSKDFLSKAADKLIGLGDAGPMKVSAITLFEDKFKAITGKDFNIDAYLDPDSDYKDENAKAIQSAKEDSQLELSRQFVPSSPFAQSSHTKLLPFTKDTKSLLSKKKIVAKIFGFLQSYTVHEATKTAQAFKDLALGTNEGRAMAARRIASVQISNMVYMIGMSMLAQAYKEIADDDDEPLEEEVKNVLSTWTSDLGSMFVGNNLSLLTGRYGPLFRALVAVSLGLGKTVFKNSDQKENIEKLAKYANEGLYTNPVTDKSTGTDWLRLLPGIGSTGATLLRGVGSSGQLANDLIQGKESEKKDVLMAMQALNAVVSMAAPNPVTPSLERFLSAEKVSIGDKERKDKELVEKAKAIMKPDEAEQKRSKELFKSAIETKDTKLASDALEKYIKAFPTKEQKFEALESILDSELSEKIPQSVGIKSEYVDDFFKLYYGAEVGMGRADSDRNYEITRMKKILENKAMTEDIVRKYEAEYEKAKATRDMLISLNIKNPDTGRPMRVPTPSWMRYYEKNIAPQMPAKAAPVKKEETSFLKRLFNYGS
jgi:hypothetical protein